MRRGAPDVVEGPEQLTTQFPLVMGASVRELSLRGPAVARRRRGCAEGLAVICGPAHGIAQHAVRGEDLLECLAVAGLLVVRVVEGGEQPVRLGNDQGLGRPADLKHLVVVRSARHTHGPKVLSTAPERRRLGRVQRRSPRCSSCPLLSLLFRGSTPEWVDTTYRSCVRIFPGAWVRDPTARA